VLGILILANLGDVLFRPIFLKIKIDISTAITQFSLQFRVLVCIDCDPDYFLYICILYVVGIVGLVVCEQPCCFSSLQNCVTCSA